MIIHDEAHCRFLQEDPKGTAYMEYTCAGNILTVTHTKVPRCPRRTRHRRKAGFCLL